MAKAMDDRSVAQRVLDHIAHGTTTLGEEMSREPLANYRSQQRLAAEIERAFHRFPTPFCPLAALPENGSYVAREPTRRSSPFAAPMALRQRLPPPRHAARRPAFVCRDHGWT